MKFIIVLLAGMLANLEVLCQVSFSSYTSLNIAETLKKDADAVYRLNEGILEITSPSKYTFTTHQVITLLNKDAGHHLKQAFNYNKQKKIEYIFFKIYDAAGNLLKTYQKKDFAARDCMDDITMYNDEKLLYMQAASPGYPCTIEVMCQEKATGYIELPPWIIASPNESVEYSSYIVKVIPPLNIKYKTVNIDIKPVITNGAAKTYTWNVKNISASRPEPDSYASNNLPAIDIVTDQFEYDGYKGAFTSWQAFGAWNYPLYEEAKPFTTEETEKIQSLVANCKTDREKIKTLYNYLEQTTRYVSIQLGIGGFKPFPVKYVNDKKYGDCKALTNYMRYMLKAVGINAYPALINAGHNEVPAEPGFPADPFNHVILCVPMQKDSVWLECTSSNNEYGFLGSFTENKNALLLTENGGVLVPTPKSNYANNILSTKTFITLNEDGSSQVKSAIFCTGDFWNLFYEITKQNDDQEKNIFINYLHYKIPEQFNIEARPDSANGKRFSLSLSYDQQYDFKTGSKLFFKPHINTISNEDIEPVKERKYDYIFDFPYIKTDTTVYLLPQGMTVDKLPAKKELLNDYAEFKTEYTKNESGTAITVTAKLILKKRIVPPIDYLQVANFFQEVKRSENEKFIVRNE